MTRPKTSPYNVFYTDGQYFTYDLTRQEFEDLCETVVSGSPCFVSFGVIVTKDIRTIVEKKPEPPRPRPTQPALPTDVDEETRQWLQENLSEFYMGKDVDYGENN
jgi:hypothetical protein